MSFIKTIRCFNRYDELCGYEHTCMVCLHTDFESLRNETARPRCSSIWKIREWDGTMALVHTRFEDEVDVVLKYEDDTCHKVTTKYFNSIKVERGGYGVHV